MKRALFVMAAAVTFSAEASHATVWQWLGLAERPCGQSRRGYDEPRHNSDGSVRGFVAEGADIHPDIIVPDGAYVCSGVQITSPWVRLGPDARLIGRVNVRDNAYVNSTVRGDVTIAGRSRIETSNEIRSPGLGRQGLVLVNATVTGDAEISGRGTIAQTTLADGARVTGLFEICNVRGAITRAVNGTRALGGQCDDLRMPHLPSEVETYPEQRYVGWPHSNQSSSQECRERAWDTTRGQWGCRSGTGSVYDQRRDFARAPLDDIEWRRVQGGWAMITLEYRVWEERQGRLFDGVGWRRVEGGWAEITPEYRAWEARQRQRVQYTEYAQPHVQGGYSWGSVVN